MDLCGEFPFSSRLGDCLLYQTFSCALDWGVKVSCAAMSAMKLGCTAKNPGIVFVRSKAIAITFGGLVLGCIEADVCKQVCVLRHLLNSTRFAHLCIFGIRSELKMLAKNGLKNQQLFLVKFQQTI